MTINIVDEPCYLCQQFHPEDRPCPLPRKEPPLFKYFIWANIIFYSLFFIPWLLVHFGVLPTYS